MYKVYKVDKYGSDVIFETSVFNEAKEYCLENSLDSNCEYAVYDEFGIIVYETENKDFGNFGVIGC